MALGGRGGACFHSIGTNLAPVNRKGHYKL